MNLLVAKIFICWYEKIFSGKCINQGSKISIIEEASTVSFKIVLIIYLKCKIEDFEDNLMVFVDLMKQEKNNIWNNSRKFIVDTWEKRFQYEIFPHILY